MSRILIVAGEASGDLHGANLIGAANRLEIDCEFFGVGGSRMTEAGCEVIIPSDTLSVMGLVEVVKHFPVIYRVFRRLKRILFSPERPDLLVLIDSPDFNLRLAKQAQRAGVPVLYYISPQVWAWRRGRVKGIAKVVDRLAVIFPFEPAYYEGLDISVQYVGNPLIDEFAIRQPRELFRARYGFTLEDEVVGLFPGSRQSELDAMAATVTATARELLARKPDCRFLLPVAPSFSIERVVEALDAHGLPITLVQESLYDTANACDAVLSVSGTATLQTALTGTPLVIFYKMNRLTYLIARMLIRVPFIGLANIVAGEQVAREFIQDDANPQNLADELCRILDDAEYRESLQHGLKIVRKNLGESGCSERVAIMVQEMCQERCGGQASL